MKEFNKLYKWLKAMKRYKYDRLSASALDWEWKISNKLCPNTWEIVPDAVKVELTYFIAAEYEASPQGSGTWEEYNLTVKELLQYLEGKP